MTENMGENFTLKGFFLALAKGAVLAGGCAGITSFMQASIGKEPSDQGRSQIQASEVLHQRSFASLSQQGVPLMFEAAPGISSAAQALVDGVTSHCFIRHHEATGVYRECLSREANDLLRKGARSLIVANEQSVGGSLLLSMLWQALGRG